MVLINVKICEDPLQHCVICIYRYHREWNRDLVYFICILCVKEDWRNDWIVHVSGEADGNCNSHGIWNKITWWPFGNDYWQGISVFLSFQYWGLNFLPFLFVCLCCCYLIYCNWLHLLQTFADADADKDGKINKDKWKDFVFRHPSLLRNMTLPYLKYANSFHSSFSFHFYKYI